MLLFIILTQGLALSTSILLCWLFRFKRRRKMLVLTLAVFIINNMLLIYGLSEFWRDRFHVFMVVSILQGFMVYAALITATIALLYYGVFKQRRTDILMRAIAVVSFFAITGLAIFNAYSPTVQRLTVTTDKPMAAPMTFALVSDTHLGRWFGNRQLDTLAQLIQSEQVDAVLLAGDIMNDSTYYYDKYNMQAHLSKLTAPFGVYAVLGNHDYSGNQIPIAAAVEKAGIQVIDNKSLIINDTVRLVGRSDETDPERPKAADLLTNSSTNQDNHKPLIFLEHNPSSMPEVSAQDIDLHLSGHTHGGQIFPLTLFLKWFTPLVYGTKTVNDTQFLVSSGYGFGAVPFRLGTRSEIWVITLQPESEQ